MTSKYGSRKFIIALILILSVFAIFGMVIDAVAVAELAAVMPSLIGFGTAVLTAVAVMYPATNALAAKFGKVE